METQAPEPAAPIKPRRKMNLAPEERARRGHHISQYARKGLAAMLAKRTPEKAAEVARIGRAAATERYRIMKEAMKPDTPEGIKERRVTLEGKRDKLLDQLIRAASGTNALKADLPIVKAALGEIRAEIGLLVDREQKARQQEAANNAGDRTTPRLRLIPLPKAGDGDHGNLVDLDEQAAGAPMESVVGSADQWDLEYLMED